MDWKIFSLQGSSMVELIEEKNASPDPSKLSTPGDKETERKLN